MSAVETFFKTSESRETEGSSVKSVVVLPKSKDFDHESSGIKKDIDDLGIDSVNDVKTGKVFFFEGFSEEEIDRITREALHEETHTNARRNFSSQDVGNPSHFVCVAYQPQVSNPELDSLLRVIESIGISTKGKKIQTAQMVMLYGQPSAQEQKQIERMLVNTSIQQGLKAIPQELGVSATEDTTVESITLTDCSDDDLVKLSESRRLFLNLGEMKAIQDYFRQKGRDPTDCELEIIAQSWSEHCGHKTFKADVSINGVIKPPLYKRLKDATHEINHPDVLSCFIDNSGVVRFNKDFGVCIKAETHSAPSAIEPFGGAETGVGGVIRDILGTGLGAKPIAVMDVLCFGDLSIPQNDVPSGCLHPKVLLRKVVAGIASYGNKVGLPNVSGALHFDNGFKAKPIVLAGALGLVPIDKAKKGTPNPGDVLICLGGKTGKDGIHGATFSSGHMTESTKTVDSTAVQIGYPVLKRQLMDLLEKLFERDIVNALTDSGGGGLSSVTTEICENLGGNIELGSLATKYQGIKPWELLLSESQERMVLAIPPDKAEEVMELCAHYGINADQFGTFGSGDKVLRVNYKGQQIAELDLDFVLNGTPKKVIEGSYQDPAITKAEIPSLSPEALKEMALRVLNDLNVSSREGVVRQYDHVVTGCTVSPYFNGKRQDTPQDSLALRPRYDSDQGLMVTHGVASEIGVHDAYAGSLTAVIEAISNAIARGGDLSKIFLIDNFMHPRPDNPTDVGTLDRSVDGAIAGARAFGTPFVSGKDSLGGTYRSADGVEIKSNPTLVVTALSILENAERTIPSHFQRPGSQIVMLGENNSDRLGGSTMAKILGLNTNDVPQYNLEELKKLFEKIHALMQQGNILSCHDVRDGGLFTSFMEMTFGNEIGGALSLQDFEAKDLLGFLFHEAAGRFLVEIPDGTNVDEILQGLPYKIIGKTHSETNSRLEMGTHGSIDLNMGEMKNAYHNSALESVLLFDRELPENAAEPTFSTAAPLRKSSSGAQPNVLVIKAPGTNSEHETAESFNRVGGKSRIVDMADLDRNAFEDAQILAIPGGFANGDDLYAGKVFAIDLLHRFRDSLAEFVEQDKLVIGICNGFQVLTRTGLLPNKNLGRIEGNLLHNASGRFICRYVRVRVEDSVCRWTDGMTGQTVRIPIAHGEGRYFTDRDSLDSIERNKQVAFRYVNNSHQPTDQRPFNPNGSLNAIAGLTDPSGRILGIMPHPERDPRNFLRDQVQDTIGADLLRGGIQYFR